MTVQIPTEQSPSSLVWICLDALAGLPKYITVSSTVVGAAVMPTAQFIGAKFSTFHHTLPSIKRWLSRLGLSRNFMFSFHHLAGQQTRFSSFIHSLVI